MEPGQQKYAGLKYAAVKVEALPSFGKTGLIPRSWSKHHKLCCYGEINAEGKNMEVCSWCFK